MEENEAQIGTNNEETPIENNDTVGIKYGNGEFDSVSQLEEAYKNNKTKFDDTFGGFTGSPDEYSLSEDIKDEIGVSSALKKWGKENKLNNSSFESLTNKINEDISTRNKIALDKYYADEKTKLGENAETRIKNAGTWLENTLGKEMADELGMNMAGANGIKSVEKLMEVMKAPKPANNTTSSEPFTKEDLNRLRFAKDENGNRKSDDPKYREMVNKKAEILFGSN